MKKLVVLLLAIAILITSKTTYAATTFSLDKTLGSNNATYHSGDFFSDSKDVNAFNFTYIKKIKLDIDYLAGEYRIGESSLDLKYRNSQIGYSVLNYPKEILYLTSGEIKYSESIAMANFQTHEADGVTIGFDLVGILSNKFQIELNFQRSLNASSRFSIMVPVDPLDPDSIPNIIFISSGAKFTAKNIQLRYILTDNLGIIISYRSMHLDIKDPSASDVTLKYSSLGFVYRF